MILVVGMCVHITLKIKSLSSYLSPISMLLVFNTKYDIASYQIVSSQLNFLALFLATVLYYTTVHIVEKIIETDRERRRES
jgi:hypothetical protein